MPALSFMKQFVPSVEAGLKRHSIRDFRNRPWSVGDNLSLYYAQRTKYCKLIGRTKVVKVESILLTYSPLLKIHIDGVRLSPDEALQFARCDGFRDLSDMVDFWMEKHAIHIHEQWQGNVIHWKFPFEEFGDAS